MADTVLARTVVQMVATGVDKVQAAVGAVGAAAVAAGQRIQQLTGGLARVGLAAGAAGGSLLAIFGTKAMAGTVEAERFGMAMERLFRVTGDALAPYVRFATDAIIKLTHAFYTLSPQTKDLITQVALIATGVGMAAGAFMAMSGVASMLAPALISIFAGPIPKLGIITGLISLLKVRLFNLMSIITPILGGMQKLTVMTINATAALAKMAIVLLRNILVGLVNFKAMVLQSTINLISFSASGVRSSVAGLSVLFASLSRAATGFATAAASAASLAVSLAGTVLNAIRTATFALTVMGTYMAGSLVTAVRAATMAVVAFSVQAMRGMASLAVSAVASLAPLAASFTTAAVSAGRFAVALAVSAVAGIRSMIANAAAMSASLAGQVVESVRAATVGVLRFAAALSVQAVAGLQAAAVGLISMINPAKLAGVAISALGGIVSMASALITGSLTVLGGVFGLLNAAILPLIGAFVGFVAAENGVFKPGIDMGERFVRIIQTMLDIWEGMKAVIGMAGQSLYTMFQPALEWLNNSIHSVFGGFAKMLGVDIVDAANDGSEKTAKAVLDGNKEIAKDGSSLIEKMVGFFGNLRKKWQEFVNFMRNTWQNSINKLSEDMAKIGESWGIVPKGTADLVKDENEEEKKKRIAKNKEALDQIDKDNKEAMDRLKEALNKNKGAAREMAKPILDMFNKAKDGGGFHLKGEVQFEGLQGTWERLQKATANISEKGTDINQQQLQTMQDVYNEAVKMNANLSAVRQAVPAVE